MLIPVIVYNQNGIQQRHHTIPKIIKLCLHCIIKLLIGIWAAKRENKPVLTIKDHTFLSLYSKTKNRPQWYTSAQALDHKAVCAD